jgi:hypothetical protein
MTEGKASSTREDHEAMATGCIWLGTAESAKFCDKMRDFIHDSTESRVIGTPISRIRVTRKRRPRDAKPMSQSVFAATLAK